MASFHLSLAGGGGAFPQGADRLAWPVHTNRAFTRRGNATASGGNLTAPPAGGGSLLSGSHNEEFSLMFLEKCKH